MLKQMFFGSSKDTKDAPSRAAFETFGEIRIARALGEEILNATAERRNHVRAIRDFLRSMSLEEKTELVDRVFSRLALWAFDLPASESHHHSGEGGLLDHLLEVAELTARELSGPGFVASVDTGVNRREQPLWAYAGVVGAVAHDIGKPFGMTVTAPGTTEAWDPCVEPLRHFCERHDLAGTGPALWHWKPRTPTSHEAFMHHGLELVITQQVKEYLGPRLDSVLKALQSARELASKSECARPAKDVGDAIRRADGISTGKAARSSRDSETSGAFPPANPAAPRPEAAQSKAPERPRGVAESPAAAAPPADLWTKAIAVADPVTPREEALSPPPEGFYQERIPRRRGDPVENEGRLRAELDPARFLETIKRFLVAQRFSLNGLYSAAYVRPDYVWLRVPGAFLKFAQILKLPFDKGILDRMVEALGESPLVVPAAPGRVSVYAKPRPDCPVSELVRVRTVGFLSKSDLARLGTHAFEIVVLSDESAFVDAGGSGEGP